MSFVSFQRVQYTVCLKVNRTLQIGLFLVAPPICGYRRSKGTSFLDFQSKFHDIWFTGGGAIASQMSVCFLHRYKNEHQTKSQNSVKRSPKRFN